MSSLTLPGRVERPAWAWAAIALQVFTGVMAVPVGLVMIADPNGSPLGIPHDWIAGTPFGSYLLPGIVLLLVNGVGQLGTAALAVIRHPLAPWLTGGLGVGLMIWIAVQVTMIPLSFLQPVVFVIGAGEGFVALFWLRRLGYLRVS